MSFEFDELMFESYFIALAKRRYDLPLGVFHSLQEAQDYLCELIDSDRLYVAFNNAYMAIVEGTLVNPKTAQYEKLEDDESISVWIVEFRSGLPYGGVYFDRDHGVFRSFCASPHHQFSD